MDVERDIIDSGETTEPAGHTADLDERAHAVSPSTLGRRPIHRTSWRIPPARPRGKNSITRMIVRPYRSCCQLWMNPDTSRGTPGTKASRNGNSERTTAAATAPAKDPGPPSTTMAMRMIETLRETLGGLHKPAELLSQRLYNTHWHG